MAEVSYVFDATADNFRTLVLANSDLRKHLGGPIGELRTAALRALESGDAERAASLAAQAALAEPDDPQIPLDVAKLLVLQGRYAQAEALLAALSAELHEQEPLRNLLTHASLLNAARAAPAPEALEQAILATRRISRPATVWGRHDLCMMITTAPWRSCSKLRAAIRCFVAGPDATA